MWPSVTPSLWSLILLSIVCLAFCCYRTITNRTKLFVLRSLYETLLGVLHKVDQICRSEYADSIQDLVRAGRLVEQAQSSLTFVKGIHVRKFSIMRGHKCFGIALKWKRWNYEVQHTILVVL